ncbi:MAG: TonB-dependent receptor [Pseudomonadota bacterium]
MKSLKTVLALSAATSFVATQLGAFAQDEASETSTRTLDTVTITAQKREQSLQEVPLSVAVTQGEEINEQIVTTLEDLTDGVPTVTVTRTPVGDSLYIRGVGSGTSTGFQQSVGTFVDGIYRGRGVAARGAFVDIERIEVLRGPQPIYFGNSTIGGAFNIISKGASEEFEANLISSYEFEADEWVTEIGIGGPITDTLGFRLAYNHTESDGFLTDTINNETVPVIENDAVRATLQFDPTETFSATAKLEYSQNLEEGGTLQVIQCGPENAPVFGPNCNPSIFLVPGFEDDFDFNLSRGGVFPNGREQEDKNDLEMLNGSLNLAYDFGGGHRLTSVTGLVDYENQRLLDVDSGPGLFALADRNEDFQQLSQEFRLESPSDQRLTYMVGLYYEQAELDYFEEANLGPRPPIPPGTPPPNVNGVGPLPLGALNRGDYSQDQDTIAIFGSISYEVTDNLNLILGARYTEVETDADKMQRTLTLDGLPASPEVIAVVASPFSPNSFDEHDLAGSRTDDKLTPSVELQWFPSEGIMLYGSYKEAFKTGGFDPQIRLASLALPTPTDPNGGFEFDAEEAEAFEIGAKTTLLDNTLTLNVAAFETTFENQQVQAYDVSTATFITTNAGGAESKGIEAEAVWRALDSLTLNANATWLDSTFTDFDAAQCNQAQVAAFVPTPMQPQCTASIAGQTTAFAPDFSGAIGFDFNMPIFAGLDFVSSGRMTFTTEYHTGQNPDPEEVQDGFEKFDLRAGVSGNDGQWEIAFVGKNLTDEKTFRFAGELPGPAGRFALIDRGQQIGLQAKVNY